ncbi:4-phosphopantetheinyl transferase, partial [Streptomyces anulatus]
AGAPRPRAPAPGPGGGGGGRAPGGAAPRAGRPPAPALLRLWVRREALFKAGRDDVRLTAWTDHRRAAVVALAGADGALAPLLSSGPAPPSGR